MDLAHRIVLIWLLLPIPVCLVTLMRRYLLAWKYPAISIGKVTAISQKDLMVTYNYTVKDQLYTRQSFEGYRWRALKAGEVFLVRYHPKHPEKPIIWKPISTRGWLIISLVWLSSLLGCTFLSIAIGISSFYLGSWISRQIQLLRHRGSGIFVLATTVVVGLMIIAFGLISIISSGFLSQNFLWVLWKHQPLLGP